MGGRLEDGLTLSPSLRLRSAFETKDLLDLRAEVVDESSLQAS